MTQGDGRPFVGRLVSGVIFRGILGYSQGYPPGYALWFGGGVIWGICGDLVGFTGMDLHA
jgi:hypothetical protein